MKDDSSNTTALEEKYQRARRLARHATIPNQHNKLTFNAILNPYWIEESECFWYEQESKLGKQYRLVNAAAASNEAAFNHPDLAAALSEVTNEKIDPNNLPIAQLEFTFTPWTVSFTAFQQRWLFDGQYCTAVGAEKPSAQEALLSPDGQYSVFVRDHNLWLRSPNGKGESDEERPLTDDGEEHYAYGTVPNMLGAGQDLGVLGELQVIWSPDSKRLFTVQLDMRQVKSLPVVHHVPKDSSVRPKLEEYKYPMPGDTHMPEYRLVSIDIDSGKVIPAHYPPVCFTYLFPFFSSQRGWWAADSQRAYFVDLKRGAQQVQVVEFNTLTGKTRVLFEETSSTWINLQPWNFHFPALIMPLPATQELIWYSERSGWAHFYLYDLETGELKQTLTQGDWVVSELLHFDAKRRELWLQTGGRNKAHDPYYKDVCRVDVDTGELTTVVSSDHDYYVKNKTWAFDFSLKLFGVSSDGDYLVATRSRADEAPVSLLFNREGKELLTIEEADVSGLPDNWQWPEPVQLKAADGETDIYGLVFRPSDFSPEKSYPVIDNVNAQPASILTSKGFDQSHHYMCAAALAELGFIVVQIDGRGTPLRSRAFLDHADGWYTSANDITDHIAGLKQLAERYPYMDLDRVGIFSGWSTSVGPLNGLLQHPDFYKVGVTSAMPNSELYMALCSEPFEGPNHRQTDFVQLEHLAENLQGKLLMVHGMLDLLSLPAATFRMVEAFQKANKDFDLIMLPNQQHGGIKGPYVMRRIFDFFVRHLLGEEPPKGFNLLDSPDN
jgi:dipeptidyl aminopeptidase/acylaminoacyl peptidase